MEAARNLEGEALGEAKDLSGDIFDIGFVAVVAGSITGVAILQSTRGDDTAPCFTGESCCCCWEDNTTAGLLIEGGVKRAPPRGRRVAAEQGGVEASIASCKDIENFGEASGEDELGGRGEGKGDESAASACAMLWSGRVSSSPSSKLS